jgi:hypothetical protein
MQRRSLSIPEIAIIAGTRGALGVGLGLLLGDRMGAERRKGVGWALLAVGVISTIPIAMQLFMREQRSGNSRERRMTRRSAQPAAQLEQPVT